MAYADDLAIVGKSRKKLMKAIEICMKWTLDNKMVINKKKSGIIIHELKKRGKKKKILEKEIEMIPIVNSYKYLGVYINRNLD